MGFGRRLPLHFFDLIFPILKTSTCSWVVLALTFEPCRDGLNDGGWAALRPSDRLQANALMEAVWASGIFEQEEDETRKEAAFEGWSSAEQ